MGSFLEFIIEFTGELIPLYFGAFLKWIYHGGQKQYSALLEEKGTIRLGYISLGTTVLLILLFLNA